MIAENDDLDRDAKDAGYIDFKHFCEAREEAWKGMITFGDLFTIALGSALKEADYNNSKKIMRYWEPLCSKYSILYKMKIARDKALQNEKAADLGGLFHC